MSIWLFYNAFVLHFILKFDSEVNSNSYKDIINKWPTNLDEMLQQHSKTFHLIILLLAAIDKSYVLYEISQWQNDHLILKGPLWLKKWMCIKKKAEITLTANFSMFRRLYIWFNWSGLVEIASVFLFTESKLGFTHQLLRSINKQQRIARTFWFPQLHFPQLRMFSGYANWFLE